MIRFRNPVSDIDVIINVFKKLYSEFSNVEYFDLDNIAEFLARENLASSSGYIGDEALKRSYQIKDDSRKSMKMQAKSYTEIYRLLGWIHSSENHKLRFHFTYLGVHVALSGSASKDLFEECLLGVVYPNENLDVKFDDNNKPFVSIIKFAGNLGGKICRDEIILTAMNIKNGRSIKEFKRKVHFVKNLRNINKISSLNKAIEDLSCELKMQPNSVRNLTRFVISSIYYSDWFKKVKLDIYGKNTNFLEFTDKGWEIFNRVNGSLDIYGEDVMNIKKEDINKICNLGFLEMLKNADFDVDNEISEYSYILENIKSKNNKDSILFSPFQYFSTSSIKEYMPDKLLETTNDRIDSNIDVGPFNDSNLFKSNKSINYLRVEKTSDSVMEDVISNYYAKGNRIDDSINNFMADVNNMKQIDFYPLVANLLSYVFDREAINPSAGNNNLRFDVVIIDNEFSIPGEIKSPTEEEMLSVKAIRQALENKIVLLSRKHYPSTFEMSSIAIGYKIPNKRSDVYRLIEDVYKTYNINISITDIKELFKAAIHCYINDTKFRLDSLLGYRGRIKFKYEDF